MLKLLADAKRGFNAFGNRAESVACEPYGARHWGGVWPFALYGVICGIGEIF